MPVTLQVTSYTQTELIAAVRGDIGLRATNLVTDADIVRWAAEFVRMAAAQTHFYRVTDNVDSTADTMEYSLPVDCIALEYVAHNQIPLSLVAYDDLIQAEPYWRLTGSGTPYLWYVRGATSYGLYPAPSGTVVDAVQLIYTALPALPAGGSSKYSFPIANEHAIIAYCCYRASMKDATGEGGKRVDAYQKEWLSEIERMKQSVADMPDGELWVMGGSTSFRQRNWRDVIERATIPAPV
jgi:hypothetical protein